MLFSVIFIFSRCGLGGKCTKALDSLAFVRRFGLVGIVICLFCHPFEGGHLIRGHLKSFDTFLAIHRHSHLACQQFPCGGGPGHSRWTETAWSCLRRWPCSGSGSRTESRAHDSPTPATVESRSHYLQKGIKTYEIDRIAYKHKCPESPKFTVIPQNTLTPAAPSHRGTPTKHSLPCTLVTYEWLLKK